MVLKTGVFPRNLNVVMCNKYVVKLRNASFHISTTGCEMGKYGNNCEKSCGHCVNGTSCNSTTGHCLHGCDPGWQGPKCDIGLFLSFNSV